MPRHRATGRAGGRSISIQPVASQLALRLIEPVLTKAVRDHVIRYLDTTHERNVALYHKHTSTIGRPSPKTW